MIIADHVRKDCPPGSISWKYIERSVKNGRLEDIEEYRAGPSTKGVRQLHLDNLRGKVEHYSRRRMTEFLWSWCAKAERKGISLKGNELYIQLEEQVKLRLLSQAKITDLNLL